MSTQTFHEYIRSIDFVSRSRLNIVCVDLGNRNGAILLDVSQGCGIRDGDLFWLVAVVRKRNSCKPSNSIGEVDIVYNIEAYTFDDTMAVIGIIRQVCGGKGKELGNLIPPIV